MNDSRRKMLTENVLGECWHEYKLYPMGEIGPRYGYCTNPNCADDFYGEDRRIIDEGRLSQRRTFTTKSDMMDLYRAINEKGLWNMFCQTSYMQWPQLDNPQNLGTGDFIAWLFCLSDERYEARCEMVADWWEGRKEK